jgi:hypothetical protein
MRGIKAIAATAAGAGMLIYAWPRLEFERLDSLPGIFAAVWTGFVLLIVAAHLHLWLGVDRAQRERLQQVKRLRKRRLAQALAGAGDPPFAARGSGRPSGRRTAIR